MSISSVSTYSYNALDGKETLKAEDRLEKQKTPKQYQRVSKEGSLLPLLPKISQRGCIGQLEPIQCAQPFVHCKDTPKNVSEISFQACWVAS